jgi:hypothetical protein
MGMTFDEVHAAIKAQGFKNAQIFVTDSDYARPMTSYLTGKFNEFYRQWLTDHNLDVWKDRWDCDNFSSTYYVFCQMCHFKSKRPEQGIAVGELFYIQDSGGGHAVNCAITEKGFIMIEPQNGQEFELTSSEKLKVALVRF